MCKTRTFMTQQTTPAAQLAVCAAAAALPDPYEQTNRDAADRLAWEAGLAGALAGEGAATRDCVETPR
jgi:hypothetical protein